GSILHELPFSLTLEDFIAERYPGTESGYSSFKSKVLINEGDQSTPYEIYMNHVLDKEGYRFFQAGFDPDELGTHLSVNHDFWGTNITYLGYLLLYLGLMLVLFWKNSRFGKISKRLEKIVQKKAQLAGCLFLAFVGLSATAQNPDDPLQMNSHLVDSILEANKVDQEHAAKFGRLVVQDNGRMKPVNTFASEFLRKLSKSDQYGNLNAEQAMLSIMEFPLLWYSTDIIYIKKGNDSIRRLIGAPTDAKRVKPVLFFDEKGNYKLAPYLQEAYAADVPNQFQKDFKDIDQRLGLLMSVINGNNFRLFPKSEDENNRWYSYAELDEAGFNAADSTFAKRVLPVYVAKLKQAHENGDYTEANKVLTNLAAFQQNNGSDVIPEVRSIELEILYNKYDIFKSLHYYYLLFGMLMFMVILWHMLKPARWLEYLISGFQALIILAFIVQTLGLAARWYISGHAPWSDAYESMIYVSWATMGVALMFASRSKLTVASAAFVVSMILMVAHWNWMDPSIANLQPVLDSYWLMIHVAVIVGSYGPFAIGMILGIVSLILMIFTTKSNYKRFKLNLEELSIINEMALTVGLVMLTIGNFLGGMWANESWGRYWGWDPKETWALISIFVYAFVIHMRLVPGLKGFWKFNLASILAFGSILMTYFGVNFYLSGLHSYASGDQIISYKFIVYSLVAIGILGYFSNRKYRKFYKK
ncbi:MAG: cytochrome c biogenesis protein CcsA, partial [Flavobacteriaceae bacterium]|nr:cytochrome c biogenesis protein CcsA [Flavobacteriaceae bacterium]